MEEKLKDPVIQTIKGDLKVSSKDAVEAVLTEPTEVFKTGVIAFILGHPEYWLTNTDKDIT